MKGETVQYRYYSKPKRSYLTIPVKLARVLKWNNNDELGIEFCSKKGEGKGFFLWKKEAESVPSTIQTTIYKYYEKSKRSLITLSVTLARTIGWNHGDDIGILFEINEKGREGLFIWKRANPGK